MSTILTRPIDNIKIVTFGCWNNVKIRAGRMPMVDVISNIKSKESTYTDLVLLGDNYYPQGKTKKKIGDKEVKLIKYDCVEYQTGFRLVEDLQIPNKYLIMGNHEIEDTLTNPDLPCVGLLEQMRNPLFRVMFPFGSEIKSVGTTTYKYIFIDTTVYSLDGKPNTCFDKMLGKSATEIKNEQNTFLARELADDSINHFIIFGHQPLISIKSKTDTFTEEIKGKSEILLELTNIIMNSRKSIYYVCADVHMYQSGTIEDSSGHKITQIVCGTGGAEKDYYCQGERNITVDSYTFKIDNHVDSYGYVEMTLSSIGIDWVYKKVIQKIKVDDSDVVIQTDIEVKSFHRKYLINYS